MHILGIDFLCTLNILLHLKSKALFKRNCNSVLISFASSSSISLCMTSGSHAVGEMDSFGIYFYVQDGTVFLTLTCES